MPVLNILRNDTVLWVSESRSEELPKIAKRIVAIKFQNLKRREG